MVMLDYVIFNIKFFLAYWTFKFVIENRITICFAPQPLLLVPWGNGASLLAPSLKPPLFTN
jgi:hypothetical protein